MQQFFGLVFANVIVLVVVKHRQQHVEVGEHVLQAQAGVAQVQGVVAAVAPLRHCRVERGSFDFHLVAQRLEEAAGPVGAGRGYYGHFHGQRQGLGGQVRAVFAGAVHGRAEGFGQGRAQEGRGHVGPVVHVLLQGEAFAERAAPAANQADGVEVEQQGDGAALGRCFGVENVGLAAGYFDALQARGVLVQQVAQVGGGLAGSGDGEEHSYQAEIQEPECSEGAAELGAG